jgi:hypothetical protein
MAAVSGSATWAHALSCVDIMCAKEAIQTGVAPGVTLGKSKDDTPALEAESQR